MKGRSAPLTFLVEWDASGIVVVSGEGVADSVVALFGIMGERDSASSEDAFFV